MSHHPVRSLNRLLLVALLTLQPLTWVWAQDVPQRITDIQVKGLRRVELSEVMTAIRLRKGDLFSYKAVDEDVRRLDKLGTFDPSAIRVRRSPHRDGVRLTFELRERPVISTLKFEGNRVFSDKRLRKEIGLHAGAFLDVARQRESTRKIEQLYRDKRYQFVKVARDERLDPTRNTVAVTFTVTEGPQVRVKAIRFVGNKVFTDRKLMQQIESRTRRWLVLPQVFEPAVFRLDVVRLRRHYKRHGYLDATVSGDYEYSDDKTELSLVFRISEGTRYVVGDVTLRGQSIATSPQLSKDFKLKRGAVFGSDDYQHDLASLRDYYTRRGYLDVRIAPKEVFPDPGRIHLIYEITENQLSKLGLLEVRGNFKTKDKVIRREFELYPGDVFDTSKIQKAVERLWALRYFRNVGTTIVDGDTPGEKNLIVEVEEGQTGNLMFGAGVSSNDGIIGQFQIEFMNFDIADWPSSFEDLLSGNAFVGAGQRLSLSLAPGTEYSSARLYFQDPHIFDSPYALSTDFFLWEYDRGDYDERHAGARIGIGRRLTDRLSAKLTLRAEEVKISNIDTIAPDVLAVRGTSKIRSLTLGASYNATDRLMQPTKGYRLRGEIEVADDALGSDWSFLRGEIAAKWYKTLLETREGRRHMLTLEGRLGLIDAIGDDDMVPIFERYFAGGHHSVRGFSYRGLGPEQNGTEVGGEFSFVGSAEYLFPIYQQVVQGRTHEMIRGVVFVDVGQVAYQLSDIGDTTWRVSAGVGLRIHLPAMGGIPIALDFGFPIVKEDDDETQVFSFSIRTDF